MDTHLQPPPASKGRGHVRVNSEDRRRMAAVRRSTKGPLDDTEDPLQAVTSPTSPQTASLLSPRSAGRSPLLSPTSDVADKDFSYLLQQQNFLSLPDPLIESADPQDTPASLTDLIRNGRFRSAAVLSAQELTDLPFATEPQTIFRLWYIRLSCLCLIHQTAIAAQESKVLGDMTSSFYKDHQSDSHLVPWDLRVLAIRLQALGFGETKRGLMAYYVLAQEARQKAAKAIKAEDEVAAQLWRARLSDLGIRVASALIEMGDCESAARHLQALQISDDVKDGRLRLLIAMECLTWTMVGDLTEAAHCLTRLRNIADETKFPETAASSADDYVSQVSRALLASCNGEYKTAISNWQALQNDYPQDLLTQQNLAVCQLYTCEMVNSRGTINSMLDGEKPRAYPSLLFNMASLYELTTENAPALKLQLAQRLVVIENGSERSAEEFKL